jgi:hypothetical protein
MQFSIGIASNLLPMPLPLNSVNILSGGGGGVGSFYSES